MTVRAASSSLCPSAVHRTYRGWPPTHPIVRDHRGARVAVSTPKCQIHNMHVQLLRYRTTRRHSPHLGNYLPRPTPRRAQAREKSYGSQLECGLLFWDVMDITHLALMLGPLLGAAAGYLVDGATGATSGFVIPIGPLVVAWLVGGR
jgi:hypothetical protein